jgi:hypothetical protein
MQKEETMATVEIELRGNRRGRPRVHAITHPMQVRLPAERFLELRALADEESMAVATWVRRLCLREMKALRRRKKAA